MISIDNITVDFISYQYLLKNIRFEFISTPCPKKVNHKLWGKGNKKGLDNMLRVFINL